MNPNTRNSIQHVGDLRDDNYDDVHLDLDDAGPGDDVVMVSVPAAQLAGIADLLAVLDEFLRSSDGAIDRLAEHLAGRAAAADQDPGTRLEMARYDANLLIDQLSLAARALRHHRTGGDHR